MARNEVFRDADHLSLPVPANTASGTPVAIGGAGGLKGITETAEGRGGNATGSASVSLTGAYRLSVSGAVTAIGAPVYIPPAGGGLTTTATSNEVWGHALETKGAATAPILVRVSRA